MFDGIPPARQTYQSFADGLTVDRGYTATVRLMTVVRTYRPDERPDIEVLIGGQWCKGELRQWSQGADGQWSAQVNWRRRAGETFIDTFPADRIRPDEILDPAR